MCDGVPSRSPPHRAAPVRALLSAGAFMTHQSCATYGCDLLRGLSLSMTRQGHCRNCDACMASKEVFRVLTACRGADDGVAGPTTGTDKGNPTVTPRYANTAASGSRDRARHFHLCGC